MEKPEIKYVIPINQATWGFIGMGYSDIYNNKTKKVADFTLDTNNPLYIDFAQKEHTMVIATSGFGKSFLAGVIAEENIRINSDSAIIMFDRMGIFSTLDLPAEPNLIEKWNQKCNSPYFNIEAKGIPSIEVWIPLGVKDQYDADMYHHVLAIKPSEISTYVFCLTFNIKMTDPQANLFRRSTMKLRKDNPQFTMGDLTEYLLAEGENLRYKSQTVDALTSKLETLSEMGIVSNEYGLELPSLVRKKAIIVIDVSNSDEKTMSIIVNFLTEKILRERVRISNQIKMAQRRKRQIFISNYIPSTHLIIDEAHNFLPKNEIFAKIIKEGRNIGIKITAISQGMDLSKDLYENIKHMFVGFINNEPTINSLRQILPIMEKPAELIKEILQLERGCFIYYNLRDKYKKKIRVRPRKSLHSATTEIEDETKYMLNAEVKRDNKIEVPIEKPQPIMYNPESTESNDEGYEITLNENEKKIFDWDETPEPVEINAQKEPEKSPEFQKEEIKPPKEESTPEKEIEKSILKMDPKTEIPKAPEPPKTSETPSEKETKVVLFSQDYSKQNDPQFCTIRLKQKYSVDQIYFAKFPNKKGNVLCTYVGNKLLQTAPDEFLLKDTDTNTRADAIANLRKYYPDLTEQTMIYIARFKWV